MPTATPNLNLQKFDSTDSTSTGGQFIDAMASNMDTLDSVISGGNIIVSATLTNAAWQGESDVFTQTVSNENFKANQKFNISFDNDTINHLLSDGVIAMRADNVDGICVVNALGSKPSGEISIQIEIVNVTSK